MALAMAMAAFVPGLALRVTGAEVAPPIAAACFGLAIVGAAFILAWAAEVAQMDISAGLAVAVLAFVAILPEYAVDFVFGLRAGEAYAEFGGACQPPGAPGASPCSLALANMTGSNRLLVGFGWSMVVFVAWYQLRRRRLRPGARDAAAEPIATAVQLPPTSSVPLAFLALAAAYALTLPLKGSVTLLDTLVLLGIFAAYIGRIARAPAEEPELVGPSRWVGGFTTRRRRIATVAMFLVAAGVILAVAEAFADALVHTGREVGVNEFLLVQWVAPLASETPELLVAFLYAWRVDTAAGIGTLLSAKIYQWTLIVGTLPVVFAAAGATTAGLPIDLRQRHELLVTAALLVFALGLVVDRRLGLREAQALFALYVAQFALGAALPDSMREIERLTVAGALFALGGMRLLRRRAMLVQLMRHGLVTPYRELAG